MIDINFFAIVAIQAMLKLKKKFSKVIRIALIAVYSNCFGCAWECWKDFSRESVQMRAGTNLFLKGLTVYWWYKCNLQSVMYAIIAMYFGKNLTLFSYMFSIHGLKTLCMVLTNSSPLRAYVVYKVIEFLKSSS